MAQEDTRLIVTFENHSVVNEAKTRDAGRPVFDDMEVCRIRMGGDRLQAPVFPAWAEAPGGMENDEGYVVPCTYAEKYAEQYKRFKEGKQQTKDGTPIDFLPFLTPAKVKELKAVHIYTAEALADLDGQPLKTLGQGGRDWKNQARAYLDNAKGSAVATKLALENEELRRLLDEARKEHSPTAAQATERVQENLGYDSAPSEFDSWEDELLKEHIKEKTGKAPRGNPSHETLVKMADELAGEP
jgi:hypothetical protein